MHDHQHWDCLVWDFSPILSYDESFNSAIDRFAFDRAAARFAPVWKPQAVDCLAVLLHASRTGSNHPLAVLATDIQQRLIVVQEGFEMFERLGKDNYSDGDSAFDENRTLHLRSILKESIDLPAEVLSVEFSIRKISQN